MRLFKILSISALCLLTGSVVSAQTESKCLIRVEQTFNGWVDCHSHTPKWAESKITIGGNDTPFESGNSTIDLILKAIDCNDGQYKIDDDGKLEFDLSVNELEHSEGWHEKWEIKSGVQRFHKQVSERCGGFGSKSEGYDATLTVVFDNPIGITRLSESSLTIEDGDKLELKVGKFYDNGREPFLQYRCDNSSDASWMNVSKQPQIMPDGILKLVYEDVVGKYYEGNDRYTECVGKRIEFRIVKTLLDGETKTYGSTCDAKFYHKGPEFTVADIRRPDCEDDIHPLQIKIRFDKDDEFKKMSTLDGYEWIVISPKDSKNEGNTFYLTEDSYHADESGYHILKGEGGGIELSDFLKGPNGIVGKWEVKLQCLNCEDFTPVSKEFDLPDKLKPIQVNQLPNDESFQISCGSTPYINIQIQDNETGRLPYNIINDDGDTLATIEQPVNLTDEEARRCIEDFKKNWTDSLEVKKKFYDSLAKLWYKDNKDLRKIFWTSSVSQKINDGPVENDVDCTGPDVSLICSYTDSANKTKAVAVLTHISFSSLTESTSYRLFIFDCSSERGEYPGFDLENCSCRLEKNGNGYKLSLNGTVISLSPTSAMKYVCKNGHDFLAYDYTGCYLFHDRGDEVEVYSVGYRSDFISSNGLIKDVSLCANRDIVLLDNGNVTLYNYNDGNWGKCPIETSHTPKSARDVVVTDNCIEYNAANGKSYKEYFEDNIDVFLSEFNAKTRNNNGNAMVDRSSFNSKWENYKKQVIYRAVFAEIGYPVVSEKLKVNQSDVLRLIDKDGCSYEFDYFINANTDVEVNVISKTKPTNTSGSNGSAVLQMKPAWEKPIHFNDETIVEEVNRTVNDLHWGNNTIEFQDYDGKPNSISIPLVPEVAVHATPQTCSALGTITISGEDAGKGFKWVCYPKGNYKKRMSFDGTTLGGLEHGEYLVKGYIGRDSITVGDVKVEDKVFRATLVTATPCARINEKGAATIKVTNPQGTLKWTGYNDIPPSDDNQYLFNLSRGNHKIVVADDNNCPDTADVSISGPDVNNAEVSVVNKDGKAMFAFAANLVGVVEPKLLLYKGEQTNPIAETTSNVLQIDEIDVNGTYKLTLEYKVEGGDGKLQTINLFEGLAPLHFTTKTQYSADTQRCYGTKEAITIGIGKETNSKFGDKVEYRINNGGPKSLDPNATYTEMVDDGICRVVYSTETSKKEGLVTITNVAEYTDVLTILPGRRYWHRTDKGDITCFGSNDGKIILKPDKGEKERDVWLSWKKVTNEGETGSITSFSDLGPGKYIYYIVDGLCPTFAEPDSVIILGPQEPFTIEDVKIVSNPTCHEKDGEIELKVSGGWGGYRKIVDVEKYKEGKESYIESLGELGIANGNVLSYAKLSHGPQHFTVVDDGLCELHIDDIELKQYTNPQITEATTVPAKCHGSADGEMAVNTVIVDPSVKGLDLLLSVNGGESETLSSPYQTTIKGQKEGYYTLRVSDANECKSDEITVHVDEPEPLVLNATMLDDGRITYKGGNDGRMEIKVSGGNEGVNSVSFNNNNVLVPTNVPYIVDGMSAGQIEISAKDKKGCPSNDTTLTFIEPDETITIEAESQAALCHAMTGSVKVTATGGWGDHRIRLVGELESRNSGEQSEASFESLYAGDYTIEVTDRYGATATQRVRVDAPEPISHELITTPDHCGGNGGGMIELSGGTGDYVSLFNMGADSIHGNRILVGNLVGGRDYTLTTWDANRCESRMTFTMPDEQLRAEIKYAYNANGSATLTAEVKGGIAPYTYKWRNVSGGEELGTSSTQTVTKSGIYRLDIADASGCSYKTMQDVLMAGSIVMRVKSVTRATNPENNNGAATIICKATQSANLRLYHLETDTWTSSITMQDETTIRLGGLQSGHYSVEGELDNGNMQTAMFFIAPYEPMEVTKMDVKHVSAPGRSDARVVVDFVGGIAPYVVNDTAAFETSHIELTNLAAGSIALSVADSAGNVLTKDVEILEPEPLVVTPSKVDDATCSSYTDGSVVLTATGGWPGYQFAKRNEEYKNSAYFGELGAGERIFKVVDKYGVEDSVSVTVGEPEPLRASVAAVDSVRCKGENNGAAHFMVTGGTAPYRTTYEKETLDGTDVAQLLSGSYVMKFTDSHQCKSPDTISIYIPEPDLLELANDYVTHTTCELDNGKIAIEVKGGSLPYRYEWTENGGEYGGAKTVGMSRSEAENLKQNGLYQIDIIDLHGCHTQYEKRIEHSENPRVLGVATTDVLCYGSSDGIAEVDSSQVKWGYPKANYSLTWPQGQTGVMSVNTLPAGIHTVRITDDNNCTTTREFTVGTPEPVKNHLASVRDALCYSYSDGRIETHTTGGVGEYKYAWSTGDTTSFAENLRTGVYTVVVADSHECKDTAIYEVGEPEELKVNLGDDVLICPGNVHVFDAGEYATYSWSSVAKGEEVETERHLATGEEGDYAIKVTDEIGCIARDTVNLRIGENALQANFLMASDAAVNDTIVLIELSNMPVDSVRWQYDKLMTVDVEEAEEYMFNLMAESTGRYYITMWAYSGGCESFEQKFIDIYEAVEDSSNFKIGYDPLIKQAKVSPNPNDGEFSLIVVLREKADVDVMVHDVNNGRQVEHVVLKDSDKYNTRFNIRQWGSGIFVLSIVSGSERRAIKVLCVR